MRAHSEQIAVTLGLALLAGIASAAAPSWPTPQAIEQARDARPFPDLKRLDEVPVQGVPKVTPTRPALDIEAIARRHVQLPGNAQQATPEASGLRIFVTLAMPEASIRLLVEQAERSGATLVLRGLKDNSMKQTLAAVQSLIGPRQVAWNIDPEAFTRYGIRHAPTFVLNRATDGKTAPETCAGSCVAGSAYFSVAGDVSLDYALETIVRRHPDAARFAAPILKRLRVTP